MTAIRRVVATATAIPVFLVAGAGVALAGHCVNGSKPAGSGVRVFVNTMTGALTFNDPGLARQYEQDPEATVDRFSGLFGFDFDGDGVVDVSTYLVTPDDELPEQAQHNGAACRGILHFGAYMACLAG